MRGWTVAALAALCLAAGPALGSGGGDKKGGSDDGDPPPHGGEALLGSDIKTSTDVVRMAILRAVVPGTSEKVGCRMQIISTNDTTHRVNVRILLRTYDARGELVDTWLVPTGELQPGEEFMKVNSCRGGRKMKIARDNKYGWPVTCDVDGEPAAPCPVSLKIRSSMDIME
jgi:hypothetical protein